MAARRAQGPAQSYALVIAGASVVAALVTTYKQIPGAPIVWAALMVAGWIEQGPQFTGKKDQRGFPTPAHPGEQKAMNTFRFWKDVRWRLVCPTMDWLPGWPVLGSFLAAVAAAALASFAPISPDLPGSLVGANVACAYVVVAQVFASRRRTVAQSDECPGTRTDTFMALFADKKQAISLILAAVAVAAVVVFMTGRFLPQWVPTSGPIGTLTGFAFPVLAALAAAGAVLARPWQTAALATWRELVVVRAQWEPRWQMLKSDPAPYLVAHKVVGDATVDTFDAPASMGAAAHYQMSNKITPTLGTNMKVAVLEVANVDGEGQPVQGTCHPLRFDVVMWPADKIPDITVPGTDPAVAELLIRCAMGWAADMIGFARFVLTSCDVATTPESAVVWATQWATTSEIGLNYLRKNAAGPMSSGVQAEVLVDHRAMGGQGLLFVGPCSDPDTEFDEQSGLTAQQMAEIAEEDEWGGRWYAVLKQNVNAPVPQFPVKAQANLADGTTVFYQPFVTLSGEEPAQYMGLEAKLAATIPGSAPFMASFPYSARGGDRAGERHPQAFALAWANKAVPSMSKLAPVRNESVKWVITGHIGAAFTAARLARPEVFKVMCLTAPTSREHIWQVSIRLYGGVTLSDVRGAATRIKTALGTSWLRVAVHPDGCTIFAGGNPAKAKLARPDRDHPVLVALDWEQAWLDSKVSGVAGLLPALKGVGSLPKNDQVQVLDFDLPAGLALSDIKGAAEKLKTATGNAFVEVRTGVGGASTVRLLVCEVNPLPEHAPYDFAAVDASAGIPFATGIDGDVIAYNPRIDPHILCAGMSGGGKLVKLSTNVPVPVSGSFPSGWATNGDLAEGDLIYAADGSTTRIVGFSETTTEPVYNVRFGDGQVVEAGASHLWKVSTAESRAAWTTKSTTRHAARNDTFSARATGLREIATKVGVGVSAPLADIGRLAGYAELMMYQIDLPIEHLADVVALPSAKKSRQYDMAPIVKWLSSPAQRAGGQVSFAGHHFSPAAVAHMGLAGRWLTARELTDILLGRPSTRLERDLAKQIIRRLAPEHQDGFTTHSTKVYPVDEVLTLLADRLELQALASDSGVVARDLEVLMTTAEMLEHVRHVSGARDTVNFAVRLAAPIDGPEAELPVDPYVMGAWLGDGSTNSGGFTGIDPEITDEIAAAGYEVTHSRANDKTHYIKQLMGGLRIAGVLRDKHIPAYYLRASMAQRLALLQGLMDTDGSINANGTCEIDLCHKPLADGVLELVRSLGIRVTQRSGPAKITEAAPDRPGHTRQRQTSTRYRLKFATDLPVFRLPRKLAKVPTVLRQTQQWNYVEAITVSDPEPMRCIKVDHPEHLFLVEGFIPTHNSVVLQSVIYGALIRGWDMFIADPTKGAADFKFAEPYSKAVTTDPFEAAAMMKAIYKEIVRRKNMNSTHGVGNYRDLPEDIRPPHMLVVIDEFTSLMGADPVPKPSDDAAMDYERDLIIAVNQAKSEIGVFAGKIARESRSAGATLVLATQKLSAKLLDTIPGSGDLKVNLSRMLLGKATRGDRMSALRAPFEAPDLGDAVPPGRGLWETTEGTAKVIQGWYDPREQALLSEELANRLAPLPLSEKVDLAPFMAKIPQPEGFEEVPPPASREPVVVELDDLEMSLDDLDVEDVDGATSAGDLPAWAVEFAAAQSHGPGLYADPFLDVDRLDSAAAVDVEDGSGTDGAVVLLDVDGVLAPISGSLTGWDDGVEVDAQGRGPVTVSPAMLARVGRLPAELVWATDWEEDAQEAFGSRLGRSCAALRSAGEESFGWWKIDAIDAWLEANPQVVKVVFADDELVALDELDTPFGEVLAEVLTARGVDHLLVVPDGASLSPADLEGIESFLGGGLGPVLDDEDKDAFEACFDAAMAGAFGTSDALSALFGDEPDQTSVEPVPAPTAVPAEPALPRAPRRATLRDVPAPPAPDPGEVDELEAAFEAMMAATPESPDAAPAVSVLAPAPPAARRRMTDPVPDEW